MVKEHWKFPTLGGFSDFVYWLSDDRKTLHHSGGCYCDVDFFTDGKPVLIVVGSSHTGVRCNKHGDVLPTVWYEPKEESAWDTQVGGTHYKGMVIQPMQYSMANKLDPLQHTVIKYVSRFRDKNGIEDLEKAKQTIDLLIQWERDNATKANKAD